MAHKSLWQQLHKMCEYNCLFTSSGSILYAYILNVAHFEKVALSISTLFYLYPPTTLYLVLHSHSSVQKQRGDLILSSMHVWLCHAMNYTTTNLLAKKNSEQNHCWLFAHFQRLLLKVTYFELCSGVNRMCRGVFISTEYGTWTWTGSNLACT